MEIVVTGWWIVEEMWRSVRTVPAHLWSPSAPAYGRYWIDTSEGRKRRTVTLGVCRTRTCARRKLREHIDTEGINNRETFFVSTAPALTFRDPGLKGACQSRTLSYTLFARS